MWAKKAAASLRSGQAALDEYREKFVDRYVENFSLLARVIRVEADVKRSMAHRRRLMKRWQNLRAG